MHAESPERPRATIGANRGRPRDFPRRILLAVVGQSPQILTETVHALAVRAQGDDSFEPTEVHVVTTAMGASTLRARLLAGPSAPWAQLLSDYRLGPIDFDDSKVLVLTAADGQPLNDIRTAADNACLADAISERVRLLTSDPESALHVSLAGGRKTMGYYAGYALSLFGREQDRLSHVLVPAEYEALPDFHYPTPVSRLLPTRDGASMLDASLAKVELAQIPFVRLRAVLPSAMLQARSSFAAVVEAARMPVRLARLHLDVAGLEVIADGQRIRLTPMQFALLACLAYRARSHKPPLPAPPRDAHDPTWASEVLADLRKAVGVMHVDSKVADSLNSDCSGNKVSPHLSRLRTQLRVALGPVRAALYFADGGTHRHKRYSVPLPPDAIEIETVQPEGACKLANPSGSNRRAETPDRPT